jgi:hypothetical protein
MPHHYRHRDEHNVGNEHHASATAPRIVFGTGVTWGKVMFHGAHTPWAFMAGAHSPAGYEHLHVLPISYRSSSFSPSIGHMQRPAAFFARATGQVGKQVADEEERAGVSRRCVKAQPCGRYAALTRWAYGAC